MDHHNCLIDLFGMSVGLGLDRSVSLILGAVGLLKLDEIVSILFPDFSCGLFSSAHGFTIYNIGGIGSSQMINDREENSRILLEAAENGDVSAFKWAVALHRSIDEPYDFGEGRLRTPLMIACFHGQVEVIKFLIKTNCVFVNFQSSDGITAIQYSIQAQLPRISSNN
ncbi:hypothetical protein FXO37_11598 [Capsicum annuum]|nr:hypothetical protein FXO37_11598 [Capsicum annuum]